MAVGTQNSLFEPASASPVALNDSVSWIDAVLFGEIALGLCVLAVASVGAVMLTGRLPLRNGLRVVVGCFVLLAAPMIASGLIEIGSNTVPEIVPSEPPAIDNPPRDELPPASYDPYAGASLRRD
ncbi:MAG: TrbC/VirB2 family protein [Pseudomonadota bacterium]